MEEREARTSIFESVNIIGSSRRNIGSLAYRDNQPNSSTLSFQSNEPPTNTVATKDQHAFAM